MGLKTTKGNRATPVAFSISKNLLLLFSLGFLSSSLSFGGSFLLGGFDFLGVSGGALLLPAGGELLNRFG